MSDDENAVQDEDYQFPFAELSDEDLLDELGVQKLFTSNDPEIREAVAEWVAEQGS